MISFNRFIAASGLATAIVFAAGWASASALEPSNAPVPSLTELEDDAAFTEAQANLLAAPSFCAYTYIMRDYTRGYVAVCELAE